MSAEAGTRQGALLCARAGTGVECDSACADTCVVERAGTLDEAWAAAEAALPDGWLLSIGSIRNHKDKTVYWAGAGPIPEDPELLLGGKDTPAEALNELASRLPLRGVPA